MSLDSQKIGDQYARKIDTSFRDWVKTTKQRTNPLNTEWRPFDPTKLIEAATYASMDNQALKIQKAFNLGFSLNARNPRTEAWIEKYAAQEIKYIDQASKSAIKQIILRGQTEGLTIDQQARLIRTHIGLTPQQSSALENFAQNLGIEDEDLAWKAIEKKSQQMINYRAKVIALTEGHTASNQGWREENKDAVERGILDTKKYVQEIMPCTHSVDHHICEECEEMEGEQAPIGGQFSNGSYGPPFHIMCDHTAIIVRV